MRNVKQLLKVTSVFLMLSFSTVLTSSNMTGFLNAKAETELNLTMDGNYLRFPAPVAFEKGSDKLKSESEEILDLVVKYLNDKKYINPLRIEGHYSLNRNVDENMDISLRRAKVVADLIISKGIDCKRLVVVGFGDTKPLYMSLDTETDELNSRIEFVNAGIKGKAIGGLPFDGGGLEIKDFCESKN